MDIYERASFEQNLSVDVIKKGYMIVDDSEFGIDVVQKLDCLEQYGVSRFKSDTEAGEQAVKDGVALFTVNYEALKGWYIVDTPENRKAVRKLK